MDLGLNKKTALVLGAGGGLGSSIIRTLAKEGARVALADIKQEAMTPVLADIAAAGGQAIALVWDLGDLSVIDVNIVRIEAELGPCDILINNTGGPRPHRSAGRRPTNGPSISKAWCCRS
jgi:3-oxoacyl-[acyl-carrier protein] reductase